MAGQGTIGLEILDEVPDLDAVIVPVGGAGLVAGIATAVKHLKPNVKIYVSSVVSIQCWIKVLTVFFQYCIILLLHFAFHAYFYIFLDIIRQFC